MPDVVDRKTRSRMMAGIKGKNTKPEILIRSALHKQGLRFRLHAGNILGRPDLVFPKYGAVIFINGCFWHGHRCHLFKQPSTRSRFWKLKIGKNRTRDKKVRRHLKQSGWRHLTIWECAIRGPKQHGIDATINRAVRWIKSARKECEIKGS